MAERMIEKRGLRYETCGTCGERWNVARDARIGPGGYMCPRCRDKLRRGVMKEDET